MGSEKQLYKGLDNHAAASEARNLNSIFYQTKPKRTQIVMQFYNPCHSYNPRQSAIQTMRELGLWRVNGQTG